VVRLIEPGERCFKKHAFKKVDLPAETAPTTHMFRFEVGIWTRVSILEKKMLCCKGFYENGVIIFFQTIFVSKQISKIFIKNVEKKTSSFPLFL
jgi:hypothetical protein